MVHRHTCFFRHAKEVVTPESKLARAAATMPGISFTLVSDMTFSSFESMRVIKPICKDVSEYRRQQGAQRAFACECERASKAEETEINVDGRFDGYSSDRRLLVWVGVRRHVIYGCFVRRRSVDCMAQPRYDPPF